MFMFKIANKEQGSTLVEVMLVTSLLGFVTYVGVRHSLQVHRILQSIKVQEEVSQLREYLRSATSCPHTLDSYTNPTTSVITCSGSVALKNNLGVPLLTQIMDWDIQTTCDSTTGLTIRIQKIANGSVALHPSTQSLMSFTNTSINPLFGKAGQYGLCESSFQKRPRVRIMLTTLPTLGFPVADCDLIKPATTDPNAWTITGPGYDQYRLRYTTHLNMTTACSTYCKLAPHFYLSGYFLDCNSLTSEAQCVCFR